MKLRRDDYIRARCWHLVCKSGHGHAHGDCVWPAVFGSFNVEQGLNTATLFRARMRRKACLLYTSPSPRD
eukprot:3289352-Alexandrium_andersonii.AAC.1